MRLLVLGLLGAVLPISAASADSVLISSGYSTESLGEYTGSLDLTGNVLTVTLKNTSPAANGGKLVAFAFNGRDGATATFNSAASVTASSPVNVASFSALSNASAQPFGIFEFGAGLGGSWLGGGSPNGGLAVGKTGVFKFTTTNADTVHDFLSDFGTGGSKQSAFVVRFRGFEDDGSDKVAVTTTVPIPLPPAVLGGAVLLGGMFLRRIRGEAS